MSQLFELHGNFTCVMLLKVAYGLKTNWLADDKIGQSYITAKIVQLNKDKRVTYMTWIEEKNKRFMNTNFISQRKKLIFDTFFITRFILRKND